MKPDMKRIVPPPLSKPKEAMIESAAAQAFIERGDAAAKPTVPVESSTPLAPVTGGAGEGGEMPWLSGDPRYKQTVMIKMPEHEYLMLKWMAQTTYGASQTSIVMEALRLHLDTLFAKRGFQTGRNPDGTMRVSKAGNKPDGT